MDIELGFDITSGRGAIGHIALTDSEDAPISSANKSEETEVTVTCTLYTAAPAGGRTVYIYLHGGHSEQEDYGVGKHYTLAGADIGETATLVSYNLTRVTLSYAETETSKNFTMTIANNTVLELDRTITIYGSVNMGNKVLTIVDDSDEIVINAVTDYETWSGSVGLVSNDMASASANKTTLQAIYDYLAGEIDPTTDQAIIYLPNGTYYLEHGVYQWPGIKIWGESRTNTIIKRPNKAWYQAAGYDVYDRASVEFETTAVDTDNKTITLSTQQYVAGEEVEFYASTGGTLPAGLTANVTYYVINPTETTVQVSATKGGSAVNLTSQGTGTHTIKTHEKSYILIGDKTSSNWEDTDNALPHGFVNLTIDGSYADGFSPLVYTYAYEQSPLVFIYCPDDAVNTGVTTPIIENCLLTDNLTSELTISNNVSPKIYHVTHSEGLTDKGNFTINGGNITATLRDITVNRWFDIEQGAADGGHTGDGAVTVTCNNVTSPRLDIGLDDDATGTQAVTLTSCDIINLNVTGKNCDVSLVNCDWSPTTFDLNDTIIRKCKSFTMTGGAINITPVGYNAGIPWYPMANDPDIIFDTVTFTASGDFGAYLACAFCNYGVNGDFNISMTAAQGQLILTDCTFTGFDWVVYFGIGGSVTIENPTLVNCSGFVAPNGSFAYPFAFSVEGPFTADSLDTYLSCDRLVQVGYPACTITHVLDGADATVILPSTQALIKSGTATNAGNGIRGCTFAGKRQIQSASAPTVANTGLPGDEWYNTGTEAVTHNVVSAYAITEEFAPGAVDVANNKITLTNDFGDYTPVKLATTDTLPSPLVADTVYWTDRLTATTFEICASASQTAIDFDVDGGAGTHTINSLLQPNMGYQENKTVSPATYDTNWAEV